MKPKKVVNKLWAITRLGKIMIGGFFYTKARATRAKRIMGKRYEVRKLIVTYTLPTKKARGR